MDQALARFNMIEQQIRPWNVLDQTILNLLAVLPRERFVHPSLHSMAFSDCELPIRFANPNGSQDAGIETGETMLSPKLEARIAQDLHLSPEAQVLLIGAGTGYLAALLAALCRAVVAVEIHPGIAQLAKQNIQHHGIQNVTIVQGCGFAMAGQLTQQFGGFQTIVLSGSSPSLPVALMHTVGEKAPASLAVGLMGLIGTGQAQSMVWAQRQETGSITQKALFESHAPLLQNAPKGEVFQF